MSRTVLSRVALCLLLIGASAVVTAREVRMHGANGDGGSCPEIAAAVAEATPASKSRPQSTATLRRGKPGKPTTVRGDNDRTQTPRWHSFLPGMFR